MKPVKSYFCSILLCFIITYGQITRSQGNPDDGCPKDYSCLQKNKCGPDSMKQIVGPPKSCGKTKGVTVLQRSICCPPSQDLEARNIEESEFQESCGLQGDDRPLDDKSVYNTRWPWMVALSFERRGVEQLLCTGFLIDKLHVITAAHCVSQYNVLARIGGIDYRQGELYNVTSVLIPDGFRPSFYYDDIAILTLSREVDSPDFNPICLPTKSLRVLDGLKGTLVGYPRGIGASYPGDGDINLREENEVTIISSGECETRLMSVVSDSFKRLFPKRINHQMLCAEQDKNEEGQCLIFSSGSPLMIERKGRWFAVGLTTFGVTGCNRGPTGYTRVSEYVDWIKQNVD